MLYIIGYKSYQSTYLMQNENFFYISPPNSDPNFTCPSKKWQLLLTVWNMYFQTIFYPFVSFLLNPCITIYFIDFCPFLCYFSILYSLWVYSPILWVYSEVKYLMHQFATFLLFCVSI